MQPPTPSTRSVAIAALAAVAVLCVVSLAESFKALASSSILVGHAQGTLQHAKRNWETELSPFSGRPDSIDDRVGDKASAEENGPGPREPEQTIVPLINTLEAPAATPLSMIACWFGHHCPSITMPFPANPTQPVRAPAPTDAASRGQLGPVLSILAGFSTVTPGAGSPVRGSDPLGAPLNALSQAAPSPGITTPPSTTLGFSGASGGMAGLSVLDGVASALDGVLGESDSNNVGSGLLGEFSAKILGPLSSMAADPSAISASPTAAIDGLQSQVSAFLGEMPPAMAAGIQLASNVGGDVADALDITTDLLNSAPDVAGGLAIQIASLLNAGPSLATGLPAAAMAAVDRICVILNGSSGMGDAMTGLLAGMKSDLSNAAANAAAPMSATAAVVQGKVVGALPSGLQTLVAAAVASQQSASPGMSPQGSQLRSMLSFLRSSIATAAPGPMASVTVGPAAGLALSRLFSLMGEISQLSTSASSTPPNVPASTTASPSAAQTTIYYVQTITALMTSTAVHTSVVTFCPSVFSSYVPSAYSSAYPGLGGSGSGGSGSGGSGSGSSAGPGTGSDGSQVGPCPGQGYTCSDCLDGWFCPPAYTPAAQVPCGYGWPCYHCEKGWFCVPEPQVAAPPAPAPAPAPAPVHAHSASEASAAIATARPATNTYQYVGCYQDSPERTLRDAQLLTVAGGMTNGQCVDFCWSQGFAIAGTEDGSHCYCGTLLLDLIALDDRHCNVGCAGDITNSTTCGGSWALSIWTVDGSIQQAKSPRRDLALATAPDRQDPSDVESKLTAATAAFAWPSAASPAMQPDLLALVETSSLASAILAAVAAKASGLAYVPASASNLMESVSMIINMGMSSIAHDLSLVVPTDTAALPPAGRIHQFSTGPKMPFTAFGTATPGTFPLTAAAGRPTAYGGAIGGGSAAGARGLSAYGDSEGIRADVDDEKEPYIFPTLPGGDTGGLARSRRAPRRWAGWV